MNFLTRGEGATRSRVLMLRPDIVYCDVGGTRRASGGQCKQTVSIPQEEGCGEQA